MELDVYLPWVILTKWFVMMWELAAYLIIGKQGAKYIHYSNESINMEQRCLSKSRQSIRLEKCWISYRRIMDALSVSYRS